MKDKKKQHAIRKALVLAAIRMAKTTHRKQYGNKLY